MIKKTAKGLLALGIAFFFALLVLVALGDFFYPDTVCLSPGEEAREVFGFSIQEGQEDGVGTVLALGFFPVKEIQLDVSQPLRLVPGGELFGVRLHTKGILVTQIGAVETDQGSVSPGKLAGLQKGDVILEAGGVSLSSAGDFSKLLGKSKGEALPLTVRRQDKTLSLSLAPVLSKSGVYQGGLWVRDGAAGLGTVTFRDPSSGKFGGLGHAVCDSETGILFPLLSGEICGSTVVGITKGENGHPGEIRGKLEAGSCGTLLANTNAGVFGTLNTPCRGESLPVGKKDEVKTGKATIYCCPDGKEKKEYTVEIEEIIDRNRQTKNFILRVTDPALLSQTGGIIQGMSGSPIIQNGKLVGAVTHVLVDDPTRGYGIFIENMLETAQQVADEKALKDAS